ncbi:hypothetical protein MKX08_002618 [Trichoderma sp. CBMAI-0020]|nr:hypothetical protein MKX08_002618 [Trichoderma sp. CBMAI-0020]
MLPKWAKHLAGGTMAIMLLFGAAFIIGHHFFYQSLSGKQPPNVVYFSGFAGGLTGQQVNLAVGSVFAFLVSSALGVVITTAANQALWVAVRTKPSKLEVIDNLATATTNIWNMFDFRLWKSSPIRMTLATILWLLSIITFITPATLNIKWSMTTFVSMMRVPQIDFTSLNFADLLSWSDEPSIYVYVYLNPQYPILKVVAESTTGGRILPISSPHKNATWLLKFPGPALSCENLDNALPGMSGTVQVSDKVPDPVSNMTITRCIMYNTSYVANFTYIDNIQSIELTTKGSFNNITGQTYAFGNREKVNSSIVYDIPEVETFSYQAIMDAFGRMFVGTIAFDSRQHKQIIDTQVALTPLLSTKELNFLRPLSEKDSLQEDVNHGSTVSNGFSIEQMPNATVSMASMIEELFLNATISLMNSPLLQPNYTSPYAPPDINVTVTTYALAYSYAAQTLWFAYGIALGMTLLSLILGIISIYHNGGASYTTKFSTILRTAYCIDFSEPIRPEDTDGKDPTPRYINELTVSFPPVGTTVRYEKAAQIPEEE